MTQHFAPVGANRIGMAATFRRSQPMPPPLDRLTASVEKMAFSDRGICIALSPFCVNPE
jgi:hypothetical protein